MASDGSTDSARATEVSPDYGEAFREKGIVENKLAQIAKQGVIAAARAQDHAEIAQLQATVRALRDKLQATPPGG